MDTQGSTRVGSSMGFENWLPLVCINSCQHVLLEAFQRWLRPECTSSEEYQRRRSSIKSVIMLLLKTAATGALATVLDALIEIRRRHMYLASLREEVGADSMDVVPSPSGYMGIGDLTRAGISAWRSRLLIGIDELEKQALRYGIHPSHRFSPNDEKNKGDAEDDDTTTLSHDHGAPHKKQISTTVEQLIHLVEAQDQTSLESKVDVLVDGLLPPRQDTAETEATCCSICMDDIVTQVEVAGCRHELCFSCARMICDGTNAHQLPQCPFCRHPIEGFKPIYRNKATSSD